MHPLARSRFWTILGTGLFAAFAAGPVSTPASAIQPKTVKSKIKVSVPSEDSELLIESKPTKTTGLTREYDTPELEAGKRYEYTFTARWRPNNYTVMTRPRTVQFTAGD